MTTTTCNNNGGETFFGIIFLVGIVILGIVFWNPISELYNNLINTTPAGTLIMLNLQQTSGHGLAKHGADSILVNECIEKNGAQQTFLNPRNGHKLNLVCIQVEDEIHFGIQILNKIEREITSYIKDPERYKTLDDILKYIEKCGYISQQ